MPLVNMVVYYSRFVPRLAITRPLLFTLSLYWYLSLCFALQNGVLRIRPDLGLKKGIVRPQYRQCSFVSGPTVLRNESRKA